MTDKPEYDPPKRLSREPLRPVNITNARKHAKREKEIYYKEKRKERTRR
jgi:hypothetical protein